MLQSSIWSKPWRDRCRTRRSPRCSTDPASLQGAETAGQEGVFAPFGINTASPYRDGERADRGEVTIYEAAAVLAVSTSTIRRLVAEGMLPARQHCKGAPWIIRQDDLVREEVRRQANMRRSRRPLPDGRQQNLLGLSIT